MINKITEYIISIEIQGSDIFKGNFILNFMVSWIVIKKHNVSLIIHQTFHYVQKIKMQIISQFLFLIIWIFFNRNSINYYSWIFFIQNRVDIIRVICDQSVSENNISFKYIGIIDDSYLHLTDYSKSFCTFN
jgi:hypothetical protein